LSTSSPTPPNPTTDEFATPVATPARPTSSTEAASPPAPPPGISLAAAATDTASASTDHLTDTAATSTDHPSTDPAADTTSVDGLLGLVHFKEATDAMIWQVYQGCVRATADEMFTSYVVGLLLLGCAVFGLGRVLVWLVYPLCFVVGGLGAATVACWPIACTLFHRTDDNHHPAPPPAFTAFDAVLAAAVQSTAASAQMEKQDLRLTGAGPIDEQLNEIIDFAIRDYIMTWCVRGAT
jgi:hypothetical protein